MSGERDAALWSSSPHPSSDVLLLGAGVIGEDGGGSELGVSEPFLDEVEVDSGGDAKAWRRPTGSQLLHPPSGLLFVPAVGESAMCKLNEAAPLRQRAARAAPVRRS